MDASKTRACPECGNVVAVTDQFCSKCFARLERPTLRGRLASWFRSAFKPGPHRWVIKGKISLQTTNKQGEQHVYRSLDEVPPEFREKFEKLRSEVAKETDAAVQSAVASKDAPKPAFIFRKEIRVFKFKDASGKEQVYHSLDEMPPEQRAIFEKVRGRLDLPGQKTDG